MGPPLGSLGLGDLGLRRGQLAQCLCPLWVPWEPHPGATQGQPFGGGEYTLERLAGGIVPPIHPLLVVGMSPQDGPPDARGPSEVLVGVVLGELDSSTPRV